MYLKTKWSKVYTLALIEEDYYFNSPVTVWWYSLLLNPQPVIVGSVVLVLCQWYSEKGKNTSVWRGTKFVPNHLFLKHCIQIVSLVLILSGGQWFPTILLHDMMTSLIWVTDCDGQMDRNCIYCVRFAVRGFDWV